MLKYGINYTATSTLSFMNKQCRPKVFKKDSPLISITETQANNSEHKVKIYTERKKVSLAITESVLKFLLGTYAELSWVHSTPLQVL